MLSHPPTHRPLVLNALEARNCDGAQPLPFQVGKSTWKNESRQRTSPNTVGKSHAPVRKQDRRQEAHQRRAWKQSRGPWWHRGCFWGLIWRRVCVSPPLFVSACLKHTGSVFLGLRSGGERRPASFVGRCWPLGLWLCSFSFRRPAALSRQQGTGAGADGTEWNPAELGLG